MSLLDLLGDVLGDMLISSEPSSHRGWVAMLSVAAFLCGVATMIGATISADIIRGPSWVVNTLIGSILFGAAGAMASTLHLLRDEQDRVFGGWCLAASVAGPLMPLLWIVAQ